MTNEEALIRAEFPILGQDGLAYLDNAATTHKPGCVLDAVNDYYYHSNANPLRGLYSLSVAATEAYADARETVRDFIHAADAAEIIFTRNASESLNLIAYSYGMNFLTAGDELVVAISEHHSNLLPWQLVAEKTGADLVYLECAPDGNYTPEMLQAVITEKTRLVAIAQISNIFGRKLNIKAFADVCHKNGAVLVCDGAQSVPHTPVDVQDLDVDFLVFSGHKMYAPMGVGVLYGKRALLEKMPPFLRGGEMIEYVTREGATYAELPHKFEAGTVNVGGAVGLAAAIKYVERIGFDTIERRELALTTRAMAGIAKIPHVTVLGSDDPAQHHGIIAFKIDGVHPHDIAAIFDSENIAVRAGHHCAQPLHKFIGIPSTTRASFAFYNTAEEVDRFLDCLSRVRRNMGYGE
ncbi:MAG: SufS family cysteine desulfurase [Clostridia bacterium]|nr:SufS family cysteine desulfurase [Clostridia bacterium]